MDYRLVFTIYSILFVSMLLITFGLKKKEKLARSKLYICLICAAILYALVEIVGLLILYFSPEFEYLNVFWKLRNITIIYYMYIYICYFIAVKFNYKHVSLKELFFDKKGFLISWIIITLIVILYSIFVGVVPFRFEYYEFVGGNATVPLMVVAGLASFVPFLMVVNEYKIRSNVFKNYLIAMIFWIFVFLMQFKVPYISFIPFAAIFILFIIYYNIENPDIKMVEDLSVLKEKIDKSSSTKIDFLFNLSYDLVNPMNAIVSLSQSLKSLSIDDKSEIERDLKSIKYAGNTLLDSIDNILELSESDEMDSKVNNREYSVYELLKRMESVAIARIGAKQIKFELKIDENVHSKLSGDITKIQKILLNIINNACKYTDIGRIKLSISATNDKDIQVLHFKVRDTGRGIKDEDKALIYDDSQETNGVGLALAKKYLNLMNGTISFESIYGAGTTFYVDIPQKIVGNRLISEDIKDDNNSSDVIEYDDLNKYKIMIVDDDNLDIKVIERLLQKYNLQITKVTDPVECIERIKQDEEFNIIFLDHKMPVVDGMHVMKVLRGLEGYKIPKLVALTANAVAGAREYYMKSGFDDYISKPIDIKELDRIIKRCIK